MSESAFARRMLEKQGWKEGDGLGKKQDGISKPIKVELKMDKTGVGHNPGEDFTDHWWLRVFNDAASSITKSNSNKASEVIEKPLPQNKLYQGFRKGTILNSGKEEKDSDCSSDDETSEQLDTELPTLDDLHKFCGGATGSRAATLGIKMGGKQHRAAEQERLFNEKMKSKREEATIDQNNNGCQEPVKKKKKKKEKKGELDKSIQSTEETNDVPVDEFEVNENGLCDNVDENGLERKKKKKSKKKKRGIEEEENFVNPTTDESEQKKTTKKRKKISNCEIDGIEVEEIETSRNAEDDLKHKKKKKKHKG